MATKKAIYFLAIISIYVGLFFICRHIVFEDLFLTKGYLDNLMVLPVLIPSGYYLCKYVQVGLYPCLLFSLGYLWNILAFALNGWNFPTNYTAAELMIMGGAPYYLPHNASSYVWLGDLKVLSGASIGDLLVTISLGGFLGIFILVIINRIQIKGLNDEKGRINEQNCKSHYKT